MGRLNLLELHTDNKALKVELRYEQHRLFLKRIDNL